jgi:hypothetical protein
MIDTGYRRSPVDHRDWSYRSLATVASGASLPASWRVDKRNPLPVYDQGPVPSCVGWAVATAQTALERFDKRRTVRHDGAEFYRNIALPGGGAYIRDALKQWRDLGVLTETGKRHRISSFAAVNPRDHDAVKRAMVNGHGLLIGFMVTRQWADGGGAEFENDGTSQELGGHGMFTSGWEPAGPIGHNTWGPAWSADGRAVLPWSYWDRNVWECWAVLDVND